MPTVIENKEIEIDFSVYCGICGSGVCDDTTVSTRRNDVTVTCSKCQQRFAELEEEVDRLNQENYELQSQLDAKEAT